MNEAGEGGTAPGASGSPGRTHLLRTEFPFRGPPKSTLRRFRVALLVLFVLIVAVSLSFDQVFQRTEAEYSDPDGGFSFTSERRFENLEDTGRASTSSANLAEVAFAEAGNDWSEGGPFFTGFRVTVSELPRKDRSRAIADMAAVWGARQRAGADANESIQTPFETARVATGDCLRTVVGWRFEEQLWREETYLLFRGDRLFQLSFWARADKWDGEWPHFEKVLDSFAIADAPPS